MKINNIGKSIAAITLCGALVLSGMVTAPMKFSKQFPGVSKIYAATFEEQEAENERKEEEAKKKRDAARKPALEVQLDTKTLDADKSATMTVDIHNIGNTALYNLAMTISTLPEGMTLVSGSNVTTKIGQLNYGISTKATLDVVMSKDVKTGNYPIAFTFKSKYGETNLDFETVQTFYIQVKNNKAATVSNQISISDIAIPGSAGINQDFTMTFNVTNTGSGKIDGIKVSVEPTAPVVNKTKNIFVEDSLEAGQSKSYSVTMFAPDKTEKKNYPIKISVEPTHTSEDKALTDALTQSQYAGIFINAPAEGEAGSDGVKAPQLMVQTYSYGGSYVEAGKNFDLQLSLVNTSDKTLKNIKISLTSDEGTFIPYNASNSFFISSMAPKAVVSKTLTLITKPDAKAQTVSLNLDSAYEDTKGNALTAKDIISIPVAQQTKLDVDEVQEPQELYAGMPTNLTTSFYNTGKTTLRNLKVTAQGNFDIQGNASYFVGNMDPGRNDSYDVQIIPREEGEMIGSVIFSFEDTQGEIKTITKDFNFTVNPPMPMEPEGEIIPEEPQRGALFYLPFGIGALVVIGGIIFWRKHKKKKKEQEMDLDE